LGKKKKKKIPTTSYGNPQPKIILQIQTKKTSRNILKEWGSYLVLTLNQVTGGQGKKGEGKKIHQARKKGKPKGELTGAMAQKGSTLIC